MLIHVVLWSLLFVLDFLPNGDQTYGVLKFALCFANEHGHVELLAQLEFAA